MSLYGAMYTSVTGLRAQSTAMGAISDNLANVNTTGYKGAAIDFASQVTKQVSFNQYAPGGVLSSARKAIDAQGMLSRTDSPTDLAIAGQGFFVVNEAANPGTGDVWAYTRSGAFVPNEDGYLLNSSGFYLQARPTFPDGTVGHYDTLGNLIPGETTTIDPNSLRPVNVKTMSGTAAASTSIKFKANLPSNDVVGDTHSTDVLFYDSLGNSQNLGFEWEKTDMNEWSLDVALPPGSATVTTYGTNSVTGVKQVYGARGQLEFSGIPADGGLITIDGIVYELDSDAAFTAGNVPVDISGAADAAAVVTALANAILTATGDLRFTARGATLDIEQDTTGPAIDVIVDPATVTNCPQINTNRVAGVPTGAFTIPVIDPAYITAGVRDGAAIFNGDGTPASFNVSTIEVQWANGSMDLEAGTLDKRIALNLSDMMQYASGYSPVVEQDGAAFGSFLGVEIRDDGLITALFDNGETRAIYKIPVVTFINPNGLAMLSGSAYIQTDYSGAYTLATAGEGGTGAIAAQQLEASTVDIGEQFTNMIVTQRAYSAAAKVVTTADEMLDELIRIKR